MHVNYVRVVTFVFQFYVFYSNMSVFSYLRTLTTWHCPHSPATRCCCSNRSISPARWAHGKKLVAAGLLLWAHARTDGRTDRRTDSLPFYRPCSAYYASSANNWLYLFARILHTAITCTVDSGGSATIINSDILHRDWSVDAGRTLVVIRTGQLMQVGRWSPGLVS